MRPGRGFMEKEYVLGGDWRDAEFLGCRSLRAGRRNMDVFDQSRTRWDSISMPHSREC